MLILAAAYIKACIQQQNHYQCLIFVIFENAQWALRMYVKNKRFLLKIPETKS